LGAQRAMLIATASEDHLAENARRALGSRLTVVWNEIRPHVPNDLVEGATATAIEEQLDVVVTVGGDSTITFGKAVAVNTALPLVCVPTSYSGTGMHPQLLVSLPSEVTGASRMNALAHRDDALWAPHTDPITGALALEGVRRLSRHLESAYREPDIAAHGQVMIASCLAGIAL